MIFKEFRMENWIQSQARGTAICTILGPYNYSYRSLKVDLQSQIAGKINADKQMQKAARCKVAQNKSFRSPQPDGPSKEGPEDMQ